MEALDSRGLGRCILNIIVIQTLSKLNSKGRVHVVKSYNVIIKSRCNEISEMDFFFYQTTLKLYSNYLQTILFLFVKYFDSKAYNETLIIAIFFFIFFTKFLLSLHHVPFSAI